MILGQLKYSNYFKVAPMNSRGEKNPRTNHRSFINGAILKPIMKRSTLRNNFFKLSVKKIEELTILKKMLVFH